MSAILSDKDVNAPVLAAEQPGAKSIKSMEYHRQVLQSKMEADQSVPVHSNLPISKYRHVAASSEAKLVSVPTDDGAALRDASSSTPHDPQNTVRKDEVTNTLSSVTLRMIRQGKQYVSPSDNIMSPCTAKLNALRNKHVGKVKPKSLFAQGVAKKLDATKKDPAL
ncbi:hypothetical protein jhhlp_006595 [Lomentospora prolificans]|uniref:Spo12-like protein n=1 Tax=Lomentospora prolificans TaxID=41688 RepID=A0A2N3N6A9_9PEZI|nr:hypothetical protein jhhlp_006595 [Lomentospora prolificans]